MKLTIDIVIPVLTLRQVAVAVSVGSANAILKKQAYVLMQVSFAQVSDLKRLSRIPAEAKHLCELAP